MDYWQRWRKTRPRRRTVGTYAEPRPRRLTGIVRKTETETPYWERLQNRDRDAYRERIQHRDRDGRWWCPTGPPVDASH